MFAKFFRAYLGFLIGLPTVFICIAAHDATDFIYQGAMGMVTDITSNWLEAFLYNFTDAFMSLVLYFGLFFLLGGWLGDHHPAVGAGVSLMATLFILLAVGGFDESAIPPGPDFYLASGLGTFLGGALPYYLGYSIRRLTWLMSDQSSTPDPHST